MAWQLNYVCKTISIGAGGYSAEPIYRLMFINDKPEMLPLYKGEKATLNSLGQAEYYMEIAAVVMVTEIVKIHYDEDWPRCTFEEKL